MKRFFCLITVFCVCAVSALAQKELTIITPAETRTISGNNLESLQTHVRDSLVITNHSGEYRSTLRNIKGVLLTDVLSGLKPFAESPKVLSEYYLVCEASDGYKVVFSWNELFNSPVGQQVWVVMNIKEASGGRQENKWALLSSSDRATGRRYVKELETIKFHRVE